MIDCKNCLHSGLCMHEDKAEEYIRQHKSMRDKCILFDGEPTCNRFIDNKVLEDNKSLKERIEIQQNTISKLSKTIRELKRDKIDINKWERKHREPFIFTCQDEEFPRVTYKDYYEDERTLTKDEDVSFSVTGGNDESYFINGASVSRDEYMSKYVDFLKEYGLLF